MSVFDRAATGTRTPFLSTYRDFDIVGDLFFGTITGEFGSPPQTLAELRYRSIGRKHIAGPGIGSVRLSGPDGNPPETPL